jgi:hypothetical protein
MPILHNGDSFPEIKIPAVGGGALVIPRDLAGTYGSEGWGFESLRARNQKHRFTCANAIARLFDSAPPSRQCHEDVTRFIELVFNQITAWRHNLPERRAGGHARRRLESGRRCVP